MSVREILFHQSAEKLVLTPKRPRASVSASLLFAVFVLLFVFNSDASRESIFSFLIILVAGLFAYIVPPSEIKTTFDLRNQLMEHRKIYVNGLHEKIVEVPFFKIVGLGIQRRGDEGVYYYIPFALLGDKNRLYLATLDGKYGEYENVIAAVSAATGIALLPERL